MPKRKRNDPGARSKEVPPQTRAERLLDDGQRKVADALKLCQRFERQKLGRRVKDATTVGESEASAKSLERLNREIQALKSIDFNAVARHHNQRILLKIKTIASSDILPDGFKTQTFPALDDDTRTLLARLYKAKAVKAATDALVASFRDLIADSSPPKPPSDRDASRDVSHDPISTDSHPAKDDDNSPRIDRRKASLSPSPSPDPFEGFSEDNNDPRPRPRASTFLPSLSAVGYVSGSESDASSVNSDVAPRKNRRGQRARQAIAEKKHGARAKHLLQQAANANKNSRASGWDARRGAVEATDRTARDPQQPFMNAERARMMMGGRAEPVARSKTVARPAELAQKPRVRDDKGPIHPSWAAKKQQKAAEKNSARKFEGKRIVFDD